MDRGTEEERQRVKTDFSLAIGDIWCGGGRRVRNSVFTDPPGGRRGTERRY